MTLYLSGRAVVTLRSRAADLPSQARAFIGPSKITMPPFCAWSWPVLTTKLADWDRRDFLGTGGEKLWRNISVYIVVPALLGLTVFVYGREMEHMKHSAEHPPVYKEWPHLGIRKSVRILRCALLPCESTY